MKKEKLKSTLKKELIKPKRAEDRLLKEVETLCDTEHGSCGTLRRCVTNQATDDPTGSDILF